MRLLKDRFLPNHNNELLLKGRKHVLKKIKRMRYCEIYMQIASRVYQNQQTAICALDGSSLSLRAGRNLAKFKYVGICFRQCQRGTLCSATMFVFGSSFSVENHSKFT